VFSNLRVGINMWLRPKSRMNYWSCSRFADFIRGVNKPFALEWGKWEEWKTKQQKKRPVRYWLAEEGLNKLQDFLMIPFDIYDEIRYYVDNRWITKTHYLKTGLKPGHYYEFDHRVLYALFNELVDFVEVEYAHLSKWSLKEGAKNYKFKHGRSVDAGLAYLDWACNLKYDEDWGTNKKDKKYGKPTDQAITAQKIKDLYFWWKERPNRPEPMSVAGLDWNNKKEDDLMGGQMTKKELSQFKKLEKIEADYYREDTDKLIELIKIRQELWS
jgi:hypothetical protein